MKEKFFFRDKTALIACQLKNQNTFYHLKITTKPVLRKTFTAQNKLASTFFSQSLCKNKKALISTFLDIINTCQD